MERVKRVAACTSRAKHKDCMGANDRKGAGPVQNGGKFTGFAKSTMFAIHLQCANQPHSR